MLVTRICPRNIDWHAIYQKFSTTSITYNRSPRMGRKCLLDFGITSFNGTVIFYIPGIVIPIEHDIFTSQIFQNKPHRIAALCWSWSNLLDLNLLKIKCFSLSCLLLLSCLLSFIFSVVAFIFDTTYTSNNKENHQRTAEDEKSTESCYDIRWCHCLTRVVIV